MTAMVRTTVNGTVTEGFEAVREEFAAVLAAGGDDLDAQVAAYHHGELVVDLWTGARAAAPSPAASMADPPC